MKKHSVLIVILVCSLTILGLALLGYGIGGLLDRKCQSTIIGVGLGLLTVSILLTKVYLKNDD
jgi:hypothetical protein